MKKRLFSICAFAVLTLACRAAPLADTPNPQALRAMIGDLRASYPDRFTHAEVGLREPIKFTVGMSDADYAVRVNDQKEVAMPGRLLRKINFGGFYTDPIAYPSAGSFELDLKSVQVR